MEGGERNKGERGCQDRGLQNRTTTENPLSLGLYPTTPLAPGPARPIPPLHTPTTRPPHAPLPPPQPLLPFFSISPLIKTTQHTLSFQVGETPVREGTCSWNEVGKWATWGRICKHGVWYHTTMNVRCEIAPSLRCD